MLVAFSFRAKKGKEADLEDLLNDPDAGRRVAKMLGATRNTLFLQDGRMFRVLEFPDGATPPQMSELARDNPAVSDFLRRLAPLVEDGFDPDDPESMEAFDDRVTLPLAFDVTV